MAYEGFKKLKEKLAKSGAKNPEACAAGADGQIIVQEYYQ